MEPPISPPILGLVCVLIWGLCLEGEADSFEKREYLGLPYFYFYFVGPL